MQKQIDHWIKGAEEALKSASLLIQNKQLLHGLFFCHLSIEKAIKAHVVKFTKEIAPKSHNLNLLLEKANIEIDDGTSIFLGILMNYQLEGRYSDYNPIIPEYSLVEEYLLKTEELLKWFKQRL